MTDPKALWEQVEVARRGEAGPAGELMAQRRRVVRPDPARREALREVPLTEREERYGGKPAIRLALLETALGWIGLARSDRGLVGLHLPRPTREQALADLQARFPDGELTDLAVFGDAAEQLRRYLAGQRVRFHMPLDLSGVAPFQRRVLEVVARIPYGETRTYSWVAQQIGQPRAYRAVGQALGANPLPIMIPCHRVVGSDGSLCGYAGGLEMKRWLLQLERADPKGFANP